MGQVVNNSNTYSVSDTANTYINPYAGGIYQQATSALATTNQVSRRARSIDWTTLT